MDRQQPEAQELFFMPKQYKGGYSFLSVQSTLLLFFCILLVLVVKIPGIKRSN